MTKRLIALGTVLALLGAGALVFLQLGHWLSARDAVRDVDVIVVVGGDPDRRLDAALDHVAAGRADRVWATVAPVGPVLREPGAIHAYAARRGLPGVVEVIGESLSTREDAALVAARLGEGVASAPPATSEEPAGESDPARATKPSGDPPTIAVVSSPWHLTRIKVTFSRLLGDRATVLTWADDFPYDAERWWERDPETTAVEAVKLAGALALYGARPAAPGQAVPLSLPVRALVGAFAVALAVGAVVRPLARRLGLVARPRLFRAHVVPVPLLGGIAILAGLAGGVVAGGGFSVGPAGAVAVGGVVALAAVGLADDIAGLGARSRLVWAAAAGTAAWLLGLRAVILTDGVAGDVVNGAATVLWFVGVTHAMNLLDNLDGAAAGVGVASALGIAAVAATSGQWVVAVSAASLAGALAGYLVHNVHPARLFMGDLGALGTGFALAALALALRPAQDPPVSFGVAALLVAVAVFDTALVTFTRLRQGRQVALGGTDHTAHRLIARGWSVRRAAVALGGAQAVASLAALGVAGTSPVVAWGIAGLAAATGVGALAVFARMPVWRPEGKAAASAQAKEALSAALDPLEAFLQDAKVNGIASADRDTVRRAEDTLERLRRTERALRERD